MSGEKTPFEKAEYNIRKFTENAEMVYNLVELKKLLEQAAELTAEEQKGIHTIIDLTIENLANHLAKKDKRWN